MFNVHHDPSSKIRWVQGAEEERETVVGDDEVEEEAAVAVAVMKEGR
jgi:hypothetical protein